MKSPDSSSAEETHDEDSLLVVTYSNEKQPVDKNSMFYTGGTSYEAVEGKEPPGDDSVEDIIYRFTDLKGKTLFDVLMESDRHAALEAIAKKRGVALEDIILEALEAGLNK